MAVQRYFCTGSYYMLTPGQSLSVPLSAIDLFSAALVLYKFCGACIFTN
jgi:hypothetical protein